MKRYSLIKKVITAMSAAVLVFSCGMPAFAAYTLTDAGNVASLTFIVL